MKSFRLAQLEARQALNPVVVFLAPRRALFFFFCHAFLVHSFFCNGDDVALRPKWAAPRIEAGAVKSERVRVAWSSDLTTREGREQSPGSVVFYMGPIRGLILTSLHRLAVRTSRCGRDNPGSNPGVDISS